MPEYQLAWFAFDNQTGETHRIEEYASAKGDGYFLAKLTSDEGTVDVFVRRSGDASEIVGVER
jgi:hypothetical protein